VNYVYGYEESLQGTVRRIVFSGSWVVEIELLFPFLDGVQVRLLIPIIKGNVHLQVASSIVLWKWKFRYGVKDSCSV